MTNDEIRKLIVAELGLQEIDPYDESTFVDLWIYQGILDILTRTRCTVRCVVMHVQADKDRYTLDHHLLSLVDVENGARRRANRADPTFNLGNVQVYPGVNDGFGPTSFVLVRSDVLLVRPTPSEDSTIQVWGVLKPTKMTGPDDTPMAEQFGAIPEEWHDAIVGYGLWKGSSYGDDASGQQGERYRVLYEGTDGRGGRLGQIRIMVNKRGTARAPRRRGRLPALSDARNFIG